MSASNDPMLSTSSSGLVTKSLLVRKIKDSAVRSQVVFLCLRLHNQKHKLALFLSMILQISASVVVQTQMAVVGKWQKTTKNKPTRPVAVSAGATFEANNCACRKKRTLKKKMLPPDTAEFQATFSPHILVCGCKSPPLFQLQKLLSILG